ncbi:hypothetical protein AB3Y40_11730 [Yoonia sp. R2331]|uniref:hypothetical protein n=1 Tax=Yoonia sp. R2331 TaxID=3237238 RepID=UPI0034E508A5
MKKVLGITMAGVAIAAIAVGLFVAGGPGAARAEKRDEQRHADLRIITRALYCSGGTAPDAVPTNGESYCDSVFAIKEDISDALEDGTYRYTGLDERRYTLCADFESGLPASHYRYSHSAFDEDTGCLTATIKSR